LERIKPTAEENRPGQIVALVALGIALLSAPLAAYATPSLLRLFSYEAHDFFIERIVGGLIGFALAFVLTCLLGIPFVNTAPDYRQFK
jgi:hypothetical protein